ncbi:GNAT family N-acetyltransferase [Cytobacillus purgationiresistens]|uniref:Ribosomal protein S18 acetylase RimI-like enzyme n=1 Tax=Cytobacillus purgationiresistens TaxID=863449 RepID=A0ABU0AJI3_9BACI|nr:GNAT family N-acetyltransferase [Cytobacillus purgationiresistens]MDQ0271422.1 ribosomal protein S18 acetylase RimI-like enzyme [Cytobacillus purgationiresistens]
MNNISFTTKPPSSFGHLLTIYEALGWNSLNLSIEELERMCQQSWYCLYAYDQDQLVGMGRVISDGIVTGVICGLCVSPSHQQSGIGKEIVNLIINHCEQKRVIPQLMCEQRLETYYEKLGFEKFTIGMKKSINR